jgi:hypothetical protein
MMAKTIFRMAAALALAGGLISSSMAVADEAIRGMVGVGAWRTEAEFKDFRVTRGEETLLEADFARGLDGWTTRRGAWSVADGALRQTALEEDARAIAGSSDWSDYTISVQARKLGGHEGFLIFFGLPSAGSTVKSFWNLGGWENTGHNFESPGVISQRVGGRIETGRWYDIRLEVRGTTVRGYLDGRLVQTGRMLSAADAQRTLPRALIPDLYADPSVAEFDGVFYCYGTTDGAGQGLATSGLPVVWKSKDFKHWSFSGSIFPPNFDAKYWAPSVPILKDGRYYLFPTLDNRIAAVVSDSPEGPFRTLDGRDITSGSGWQHFPISVGHPIDAEVFRDDDGSYYMMWSQRYIAKLNADFTGFDGEPVAIRTKRSGYSEGPYMLKRNGIYYYLYTLGASEGYSYAYMMSRVSPLGPWEAPERDLISATDREKGIYGPGHGSFFSPEGSNKWYFVYLEYGRSGTNRQVLAAELRFNDDGTIQPIELTLQGVGALRSDPRYARPNLALGSAATVSSTRPEQRISPINDQTLNRIEVFSPANAVDDSNGSRWMAASDDTQPWLQLDLGRAQAVRRVEIHFCKPTEGHAYRIESSLDGVRWRPYGGSDAIRVQSPHVVERNARARYLRVTILRGEPGVWEFRAY